MFKSHINLVYLVNIKNNIIKNNIYKRKKINFFNNKSSFFYFLTLGLVYFYINSHKKPNTIEVNVYLKEFILNI